MRRPIGARFVSAVVAALLSVSVQPAASPDARDGRPAEVLAARTPLLGTAHAVETVGMTVSDMDQALAFYTGVLGFRNVSDHEATGRSQELLTGVFGARLRTARLALGDESIELTEFKAPQGRPYPADTRANDHWFQHIAIIVSDIDRAYAALADAGARHASTGPQRLPDWNPNAGGIEAYYFRDPDGHFLEILEFPAGKGDPKWHRRYNDRLFLGIDHTAIVTADTERALAFYRDTLGLAVVGASTNYGVEQEHLNNVFGVRLRITTLKAKAGPGIELLDYLAPSDGRPAPRDLRANDLAHWQTTVVVPRVDPVFELAPMRRFTLVSPEAVDVERSAFGFARGALVRDPDGHGVRLVAR